MARIVVAVCLVVASLVAGCSGGGDHQPLALKLPADYSGSGPGTLLEAYALPLTDAQMQSASSSAARITYTSTSGIDDSHPEVSAAVFVVAVASAALVTANAVAAANTATAPPTRILVRSLRMVCLPLSPVRWCTGITCRQRLTPGFCYRSRSRACGPRGTRGRVS